MRDPGGDNSSGAKGPQGTDCRNDMVTVAISLGRINDAISEAQKWIGDQTWMGLSADQWYSGPWNDAVQAFKTLVSSIEQAQTACVAAADKADQDPTAVRNYGR